MIWSISGPIWILIRIPFFSFVIFMCLRADVYALHCILYSFVFYYFFWFRLHYYFACMFFLFFSSFFLFLHFTSWYVKNDSFVYKTLDIEAFLNCYTQINREEETEQINGWQQHHHHHKNKKYEKNSENWQKEDGVRRKKRNAQPTLFEYFNEVWNLYFVFVTRNDDIFQSQFPIQ